MGYRNYRDVSNDWEEDTRSNDRRRASKPSRKNGRNDRQSRGFNDDEYDATVDVLRSIDLGWADQ